MFGAKEKKKLSSGGKCFLGLKRFLLKEGKLKGVLRDLGLYEDIGLRHKFCLISL